MFDKQKVGIELNNFQIVIEFQQIVMKIIHLFDIIFNGEEMIFLIILSQIQLQQVLQIIYFETLNSLGFPQ